MKQKKSIAARRPSRPGLAHAKRNVRARRTWHKRVLLHPFSVMVLLCAGVLIIGTTLRSFAASYDVTATVPAPLPGAPAIITSPSDQQHFSDALVTVSGTCSPQSYVKLFRDTVFSGVSQCVSQSFQIQTNLLPGANQLTAQVYSLTDQPGPPGAVLTAYYDQTPNTPPSALENVPATVWVANVESGAFKDGVAPTTSDNPTVSGWAPPWSMLTITFHSTPETCITQANAIGWWTCTLDHQLPPGLHRVDVVAVTPNGQTLTFPTFHIKVSASVPTLAAPPSANPLLIRADYQYQIRLGRQTSDLRIALSGGTAPYKVTADWGDGTTTTLSRDDASPFTVSHAYPTPTGPNKDYAVLVRATDAKGATALMQLSVVVKGSGLVLLASNNTFNAFLEGLQHWLWLIWPSYIVVVLMAVGYYLGEREEYRHLVAARKRSARPAGKSR